MKIDRMKNSMGDFYDYSFIEGNKELYIYFARNYDFGMFLSTDRLLPEDEDITIDFYITQENYNLYYAFDKLYNRMITSKNNNKNAPVFNKMVETYYGEEYEFEPLVDNNSNINWVSDNDPASVADKLVISKEEDSYKLTFIRNDKPLDYGHKTNSGINIVFRNSGSRYNPYNCMFMELYNNLQSINPEYHQIRFEELDYAKKLIKKQ